MGGKFPTLKLRCKDLKSLNSEEISSEIENALDILTIQVRNLKLKITQHYIKILFNVDETLGDFLSLGVGWRRCNFRAWKARVDGDNASDRRSSQNCFRRGTFSGTGKAPHFVS